MAVLKERLNRKNASGGYDTIYLETSSDIVIRPDGTTVEATLTTIKNDLTQVKSDLEDVGGDIQQQVTTIITGGNAKHASTHASGGSDPITPGAIGALSSGGTAAAATKLATSRTIQTNLGSTSAASFNGTANVSPGVTGILGFGNGGTGKTTAPLSLYALINGSSAITGASLADTDVIGVGDVSAATGKKVTIAELKKALGGSAGGGSISGDSYNLTGASVGSTVLFNNTYWTVVHMVPAAPSGYTVYLALATMTQTTQFGSNNVYAGSTLASKCTTYYNSMAADSKALCLGVSVEGVTAKVFVASYAQVNGGFSHFNSNANRICNYNGNPYPWWTSSPGSSGGVYYVKAVGSVRNGGYPSDTYGFRPFVAVKI